MPLRLFGAGIIWSLFPEDLWDALEKASSKPVAKVMSTWTKQMGYPVLSVEGKQVNSAGHDMTVT